MKKKYIISIDGNYDSDFEAKFYLNLLNKYYISKGFLSKFKEINSNMTKDDILLKLNNIVEYFEPDEDRIMFIIGGLAEPITTDLINSKQVQVTFKEFEEIARIYQILSQRTPSINILLIDNSTNKEMAEGLKKIDSMTISMGFNFDVVNVEDEKLISNYKQILEIIKKKGWEAPPFID